MSSSSSSESGGLSSGQGPVLKAVLSIGQCNSEVVVCRGRGVIGSRKGIYPGRYAFMDSEGLCSSKYYRIGLAYEFNAQSSTVIVNQQPHSAFTMLGYHIGFSLALR